MASNIGYTGTWKHFPARGAIAALGVLVISAGVLAGTQVDFSPSSPPNMAAASTVVRLAAAPKLQPLTVYVVSSEDQRQRVVAAEEDGVNLAFLADDRPAEYMIVVAPEDDATGLQLVRDTESIRAQAGLPTTIVDLR